MYMIEMCFISLHHEKSKADAIGCVYAFWNIIPSKKQEVACCKQVQAYT